MQRPSGGPSRGRGTRSRCTTQSPRSLPLRSNRPKRSAETPVHPSEVQKVAQVLTVSSMSQVIKALYDYDPDPTNTQELRFAKGDFFHVISREDDTSWYEACNPLIPSARGLVPVSYFEIIGKTERQSGGSATSGASNVIPQHDSGYSEKALHNRHDSSTAARKPAHNRMSSLGKGSGAMVYGVVQYDFNAERPDELEAKAGEAIIVIAQSNPEWFVAKPIGRLGGPGLIPVSFIEIRDMSTGQAVPDAQGAVTNAGVPKVEEWKKMAADYKNSSITLGKFETGNGASTQRDMERSSMTSGGQGYNSGHSGSYVSCRDRTASPKAGMLIITASESSLPPEGTQSRRTKWLRPTVATPNACAKICIHPPIYL